MSDGLALFGVCLFIYRDTDRGARVDRVLVAQVAGADLS